jgi:hypothetical protein
MVMENEPFPILPPTFSGNSRSVDVGNVFDWLRQGWATFIVNPGTWIAMMVITIVIFIGLAIVPLDRSTRRPPADPGSRRRHAGRLPQGGQ